MSLQPGTRLGNYEVLSELRREALGTVYLAFDPDGQNKVALKVINESVPDEKLGPIPFLQGTPPDEDQERFLRFSQEAKLLARLQHPCIVTILDLRLDPGKTPFMVMELLNGNDLEYRLNTKLPSPVEGLGIVAQACGGLAYVHSQGIVHRNIKPANIFVTDQQAVKILDFGCARMIDPHLFGIIVGTPGYMSPEQITGRPPVDARSDIFSLGVVLYEVLAAKRPFPATSIPDLIVEVMRGEPPELVLPNGRKYPELQSILDRALAKKAEDRFATGGEMAMAINLFLKKFE